MKKTIIITQRDLTNFLFINYVLNVEQKNCITVILNNVISDDFAGYFNPHVKEFNWIEKNAIEIISGNDGEFVVLSNNFIVSKNIFKKHEERYSDNNYLLNFAKRITPYFYEGVFKPLKK